MTPTTYQQRFITHIINLAKIDKDLANYSIREFAILDPYQLKDLRELVMTEVARLKLERPSLEKSD
jgi:hypothetical protein